MRMVSKLYLSFGILLVISLASVVLAIWSARQFADAQKRTDFAQQQYETYLSLSNHTYHLFKQFADAMLIGDRDEGLGERRLIEEIKKDIAFLRRLTGQEIQFVGEEEEEEIEELDRISLIDHQINALLREYDAFVNASETDTLPTNWRRLSLVLDEKVERHFNILIEEALEDEASEVAAVRAYSARQSRNFQLAAAGFGLIAVIAAGLSLLILVRNIRGPIDKLIGGARALAAGDLDHRIAEGGKTELEDVGRAFNRMADELSQRAAVLAGTNAELERAVKRRTGELEQVLAELKANENNRRRLLADVSHELRTPLTIIKGEADIALRGGEKSPQFYREALEKSRDAAVHTARIVDDLLFIARREVGETRLKLERVNLAGLLPEIIEEASALISTKHLELTINCPQDNTMASIDPNRIRQVIVILLDNAVRYGASEVEIGLHEAVSGFAILVSDNGPGMTEEEISRAFDRFFRGSNATERYQDGAGLGLPVAKAIVEAHDGTIGITCEEGKGTTITIMLPQRTKLKAVS